ncbi:hypothetical protein RI367_000656 [Sorochytrium milnesiophthora]
MRTQSVCSDMSFPPTPTSPTTTTTTTTTANKLTISTAKTPACASSHCVHNDVLPPLLYSPASSPIPLSAQCAKCDKPVERLLHIFDSNVQLKERLAESQSALLRATRESERLATEMARLTTQYERLEDRCDAKTDECSALEAAMDSLNHMLDAERAEREATVREKQRLETELEELSRALFEEANGMVASEKRRRHDLETSERSLQRRLREAEELLLFERQQLQELRQKLADSMNAQCDQEDADSNQQDTTRQARRASSWSQQSSRRVSAAYTTPVQELINSAALVEFRDFIEQAARMPLEKLVAQPYLRNIIQADLQPCLTFHPSARVATRKLVDAVMNGRAHIESRSASSILSPPSSPDSRRRVSYIDDAPAPESQVVSPGLPRKFFSSLSSQSMQQPVPSACNLCATQCQAPFLLSLTPMLSAASPSASSFSLSSLASSSSAPDNASSSQCSYKYPVCRFCRNRIVTACDFANFVLHVQHGLYTSRPIEDVWNVSAQLRSRMLFTRIGGVVALDSDHDAMVSDTASVDDASPNSSVTLSLPRHLKPHTSSNPPTPRTRDSVISVSGSE